MPVANFKTVKEKENKSELKCNMTKKRTIKNSLK